MAQYHCNYCQENIYGLRVKCAECTDFDLCLKCFCCGAEIGCHRSDHQYQIIDCGNFPVFDVPHDDWRAHEELRLLDAVEQYGFGNWDDVASQVRTKSGDEAKDHYSTLYIAGTIGRATWPQNVSCKPKDHTAPEAGPLSPGGSSAVRPQFVDLTPQEQQELGYMPNRDDFEREYDNEAELVASNLAVSADDEDIDVALKLAHVDMFSWRLRERLRRKRIARDYNLVSQFYDKVGGSGSGSGSGKAASKGVSTSKKRNPNEDKELHDRMRVFSQFHTCQEQEQLLENIQNEKELKSRIKELVRYRRSGLTKLEDCSQFDSARYKREKKKENKKKLIRLVRESPSGVAMTDEPEYLASFLQGSSGVTRHRKSSSSTASRKQEEKGASATTIDEPNGEAAVDEPAVAAASTVTASSSSSSSLSSSATACATVAASSSSTSSSSGCSLQQQQQQQQGYGNGSLPAVSTVAVVMANEVNGIHDMLPMPMPLSPQTATTTSVPALPSPAMEQLAGHEMLSCREKKLCGTLGLKPAAYLTLKTVLLKDHLLRRQGIPVKSHPHHHPSGLDKLRRRRILGFMVNSGWLTTS